jgi:hypothetical protein
LFAAELKKTKSFVAETKNNTLKHDPFLTQKQIKTQNRNHKHKRKKETENDIVIYETSLDEKENILNETLSKVETRNKKSKVNNK